MYDFIINIFHVLRSFRIVLTVCIGFFPQKVWLINLGFGWSYFSAVSQTASYKKILAETLIDGCQRAGTMVRSWEVDWCDLRDFSSSVVYRRRRGDFIDALRLNPLCFTLPCWLHLLYAPDISAALDCMLLSKAYQGPPTWQQQSAWLRFSLFTRVCTAMLTRDIDVI